jgi:hypothetical protein
MDISESKSLEEELRNAGVQQFENLLSFSEKQLELFLPSLNLGDRRILRACAESDYGKKLLVDFVERAVNRLKSYSRVMSAELLCTFVDLEYTQTSEYVQRASANALELRVQGIRTLPVLMEIALMENGEDRLVNCGLRAGDIATIIACARSEFGEAVLASWKRRISARIQSWYFGDDEEDTYSESEPEPEPETDLKDLEREMCARHQRAAEELEATGSS